MGVAACSEIPLSLRPGSVTLLWLGFPWLAPWAKVFRPFEGSAARRSRRCLPHLLSAYCLPSSPGPESQKMLATQLLGGTP